MQLVHDLDFPNATGLAIQISNQIRQQLEEYAGVALHPLFHMIKTISSAVIDGSTAKEAQTGGLRDLAVERSVHNVINGVNDSLPSDHELAPSTPPNGVTATATMLEPFAEEYNPDDTYRCIVSLNVNLINKLYTDKFEWSLLHPPGIAENFAKQTCSDIGLTGEWIPSMTHAIYEAVLRLKKEACESGGLFGVNGYGCEIHNDAIEGRDAGWRFDNEHLADEWEPKIEILSKEEIEKREGDRERQIRRLRRETARFSSTTHVSISVPQQQQGYFDQPPDAETPMGRGERSKKKRRFRSLSPLGRSGTPSGTPDTGVAGYGGGGGLTEWFVTVKTELYSSG